MRHGQQRQLHRLHEPRSFIMPGCTDVEVGIANLAMLGSLVNEEDWPLKLGFPSARSLTPGWNSGTSP